MAKLPQRPDLSATVVLDSNALFSKNDVEIVADEFQKQLQGFTKFPVTFVIPKIVFKELMFQKLAILKRFEGDANRAAKTLGKLTQQQVTLPPSVFTLTRRLRKRWSDWCSMNAIRLEEIPYQNVNWKSVVSASIHRRKPFSPYEPNSKAEKGFRDALVLETLGGIVRGAGGKRVVFICNDSLLRDAAAARFTNAKFEVHRTTSEYLSYLELQSQNFLKGLLDSILEDARKLFYTQGDQTTLYNNLNLPAKIQREFPVPFAERPSSGPLDQLVSLVERFSDVTYDGVQLGETNFTSFDPTTKTFTFISGLRFGRIIRPLHSWLAPETLRIAEFAVKWTASWTDEQVSNPQLSGIEFGNVAFESASDEAASAFGLPTQAQRTLQNLPPPPPTPSP